MGIRRDGEAVAEGDDFAGIGGDAIAGNNDADKIHRIGGGDGNDFTGRLLMAEIPRRQAKRIAYPKSDGGVTTRMTALN